VWVIRVQLSDKYNLCSTIKEAASQSEIASLIVWDVLSDEFFVDGKRRKSPRLLHGQTIIF